MTDTVSLMNSSDDTEFGRFFRPVSRVYLFDLSLLCRTNDTFYLVVEQMTFRTNDMLPDVVEQMTVEQMIV